MDQFFDKMASETMASLREGGGPGCGCKNGGKGACKAKKGNGKKRMSGGSLEDYMHTVNAAASAIGVESS